MWKPRSHSRLSDGHNMKVDEIQRALRRDGYVILRRFFPWATVEEARVAAAKLVDKVRSNR